AGEQGRALPGLEVALEACRQVQDLVELGAREGVEREEFALHAASARSKIASASSTSPPLTVSGGVMRSTVLAVQLVIKPAARRGGTRGAGGGVGRAPPRPIIRARAPR